MHVLLKGKKSSEKGSLLYLGLYVLGDGALIS